MLNASIVTYNTPKDEVERIRAILSASPVVNHISIIDNTINNRGYGAAHNIALQQSLKEGVEYHLVVNSDISFDSAILAELCAYMDSHPDVGHLMPRVTYPDGSLQYLCKLLPTPFDLFGRRFLPQRFTERSNMRYELRFTGYNREMNVPYLSGCFMLLRTEALRQVGLFDERYFLYPEDVDLTRRIHRQYKTMYYPYCTIVHNHRRASYKSLRMTWVHLINMCKYFNKWGWLFDEERRRFNKETIELYKQ
ncbi:MAG: glycosyltransferase family 2 protein [Paludibacteraceae bacterium]|nr:glycosyltransferase family 2 protein [Paludibacteraceae bacterium]